MPALWISLPQGEPTPAGSTRTLMWKTMMDHSKPPAPPPKTDAGRALSQALSSVSTGVMAFYDTDHISNTSYRRSHIRNNTRPNIYTAITTLYKNLALNPTAKPERTFAIAVAHLFRNMIITGKMVSGASLGMSDDGGVVAQVRKAAHASAASIDRTYGQLVDEDDEIMALAIDLYVVNEDHITGDNPYVSALELVMKVLVEQGEAGSTHPSAVPHLQQIHEHVRAARDNVKRLSKMVQTAR